MSQRSPVRTVVRLAYMGGLARRMGSRSEELALEAPVTVRTVLEQLIERHGEGLRDLFFNQYGWLDPRLFFLIDGEGATLKGGLEAPITGTEEITLVLGIPMSGG
jgi:hypothetical protein